MSGIVEKIKNLFGSAGKLAFALFLAGAGLLAIVELYSETTNFLKNKSLEKYAIATPWATDLSQIGLKLEGKRKYLNGGLAVTLNFIGYPKFLSDPILKEKNKDKSNGFFLHFQDSDGFDIVKIFMPMNSLNIVVNNDGNTSGLSGQVEDVISAEQYARIANVRVAWNLDTETPKPVAPQPSAAPIAPVRRDDPTSNQSITGDHCEPGISRAIRLKRLAQHGTVRQTGDDTYRAGSHEVMFGYDGRVIHCD